MIIHFIYLSGIYKKGKEGRGLHCITLSSIYSNTKYSFLSWLLSKPGTYSSSSHLSSIILPVFYLCFFFLFQPFSFPLPLALLPSLFLQCLLCASLPPSASFSLSPFLQNTAGHVDEHMERPLRGRAQCQYADDPCSAQHKHITQHNNESHLAIFNSQCFIMTNINDTKEMYSFSTYCFPQ